MFAMDELLINVSVGLALCCKSHPNVKHSAVAVLYRTVFFFPSPPVATSLSQIPPVLFRLLSVLFRLPSVLFLPYLCVSVLPCLMIESRAVASR